MAEMPERVLSEKTVGGPVSSTEGPAPSDSNKFVWIWNCLFFGEFGKEGLLMSDFEILTVVFTVLSIVVTLLIKLIESTKK